MGRIRGKGLEGRIGKEGSGRKDQEGRIRKEGSGSQDRKERIRDSRMRKGQRRIRKKGKMRKKGRKDLKGLGFRIRKKELLPQGIVTCSNKLNDLIAQFTLFDLQQFPQVMTSQETPLNIQCNSNYSLNYYPTKFPTS